MSMLAKELQTIGIRITAKQKRMAKFWHQANLPMKAASDIELRAAYLALLTAYENKTQLEAHSG